MNSKERIIAAFKHKESDKVPIGEIEFNSIVASKILKKEIFLGFNAKNLKTRNIFLAIGEWEDYSKKNALSIIELCNKLNFDFFRVNLNPGRNEVIPKKISDNIWRFEDNNLGMWEEITFNEENDTWYISNDAIRDGGIKFFKNYLKKIKNLGIENCRFGLSLGFTLASGKIDESEFLTPKIILNDRIGSNVFLMGNARLPFPSMYPWLPLYLEWTITNPKLIKEYSEIYSKVSEKYINELIDLGISGIIDATDFCFNIGPMVSPNTFREFLLPYIKKYSYLCHLRNVYFIKHIDGNIKPIEKDLLIDSEIDGYHGIEPNAGMNIRYLKKKYGNFLTLIGNIDCTNELVSGSKEDICKSVVQIIKYISPGGGHIFSSSNSIHFGVPIENFLYSLKIFERIRTYPITDICALGE